MSKLMKEENLIKEQMRAIDQLQEKIKMLKFDISKNLDIIHSLKDKLARKERVIAKIKEELEEMKRENDYSNINSILKYIRMVDYEE